MAGEEAPWYREGLRFRCTRCGNCCRGAGNVWVSDDDVAALAASREMTEPDFRREYTRRSGPGVVLRQKRTRECVFWSAASGCGVYADRPRQCRTYPLWAGIVYSRDNWDEESESCPGIGVGDLHPEPTITGTAASDGIPAHRTRFRLDGS